MDNLLLGIRKRNVENRRAKPSFKRDEGGRAVHFGQMLTQILLHVPAVIQPVVGRLGFFRDFGAYWGFGRFGFGWRFFGCFFQNRFGSGR